MEAVRSEVQEIPEGEPFVTSRFSSLGTRAALDQALSRLVRQRAIIRVRRGVFMRPKVSRLVGVVPPEPQAVVAAIAASTGETVAPHGAEAARQMGLSTQVPMKVVFATTGRSRVMSLGRREVQMRHSSNRQLALAGRPAGVALAALRYLGKEAVTSEALARVQRAIGPEEFEVLRRETRAMPAWLSDEFYRYGRSAAELPSDRGGHG